MQTEQNRGKGFTEWGSLVATAHGEGVALLIFIIRFVTSPAGSLALFRFPDEEIRLWDAIWIPHIHLSSALQHLSPGASLSSSQVHSRSEGILCCYLQVTNVALSEEPYVYDEAIVAKKLNPNKKLQWLIPVVFAAQVAFKVCVTCSLILIGWRSR